jgi:predicted ester cyclase
MDNLTLIENYHKKMWDEKNINAIDYSGNTIYQIENQQIIAYWAVTDMHKILQQIS